MTEYAQGGPVGGGGGFWLDGCTPRYIAYPAPDLSPADAEIVARFEAAPTPPEVVDAVVAEIASRYRDPDGARFAINDFRDWLDDHPAAVAAYRAAQDGGAEEAVRRVEALVAFYDRHEYSTLNVDDIRAALATQAGDGAR